MPGLFDDLYPTSTSGGLFDDLYPSPNDEVENEDRRSWLARYPGAMLRSAGAGLLRLPETALDLVEYSRSVDPLGILPTSGRGLDIERIRQTELPRIERAAEWVAPPPPEGLGETIAQVSGTAIPDVAAVIGSAAAGGPAAGFATAYSLVSSRSYREARDRGLSPGEAAVKATASGAIGGALEMTGAKYIGRLLKPLAGPARQKFLREVGKTMGIEAGTEELQELAEIALEAATGKEFSPGEIKQRAIVAPAAGAVLGGAAGGVSFAAVPGGVARDARRDAQRIFTVNRGLEQQDAQLIEQQRHEISADKLEARQVAQRVEQAKKAVAGDPSLAGVDLDQQIDNYLRGSPVGEGPAPDLHPGLVPAVEESRALLVKHTDRLLESPYLTDRMRTILEDNRGRYMRLSYRVHEDPVAQLSLVAPHMATRGGAPTRAWIAARDLLRQEYVSESRDAPSDAALDLELKDTVFGGEQDFGAGGLTPLERTPFKRRKDIPEEIKTIMGLEVRLEVQLMRSIERTAAAYHGAELYHNLVASGQGRMFFPNLESLAAQGEDGISLHGVVKEGGKHAALARELLTAQELSGGEGPHPFVPFKSRYPVETAEGDTVFLEGKERGLDRPDMFVAPRDLASIAGSMNQNPWIGLNGNATPLVKGMVAAARLAGKVKVGLTVFQPQAQARNPQSNILAFIAGGNAMPGLWDFSTSVDANGRKIDNPGYLKTLPKAIKYAAMRNDLGYRKAAAEAQREVVEQERRGLGGGSIEGGEAEFFFGRDLSRAERAGGAARRALASTIRVPQKLYVAADDIGRKGMGLREEQKLLWLFKDQLASGDVTVDQVKAEAAERAAQTSQNYERLPLAVQWIRAFPGTAPFVSFPVASMINLKNQMKLATQELGLTKPDQTSLLNKLTPEQRGKARVLGGYRAAGMLSVAGLVNGGIAAVIHAAQKTYGKDPDEVEWQDEQHKEDLIYTGPFWGQASNVILIDSKQGRDVYMDLSYMNYFNYAERPALAALRAGQFDEAAWDAALKEMAEPFISPDIMAGALGEAIYNQNRYGKQIYNPSDEFWTKTRKQLQHVLFSFAGPLKTVRRFVKAAENEAEYSSGRDLGEAWVEGMALLGPRLITADYERRFQHALSDGKKLLEEQARILNDVVKERGATEPQEVQATVEAVSDGVEKLYTRARRVFEIAERRGVPRAMLLQRLQYSRFSKAEKAMIRGAVEPQQMADLWMRKALGRAEDFRRAKQQRDMNSWRLRQRGNFTPLDEKKKREALARQWAPIYHRRTP